MSIELEDIDIITTDDISNTKQTTHELVTLEPITSVELKGPYADSDDTYSISERSDTVSDNTDSAEAIKHSTSINHLQVTVHETDLHGTTKVTAAVNNDDEEDEKDDDYKSKSNIDTTPSTIVLANIYNETHLKQNYNKKKWFNLFKNRNFWIKISAFFLCLLLFSLSTTYCIAQLLTVKLHLIDKCEPKQREEIWKHSYDIWSERHYGELQHESQYGHSTESCWTTNRIEINTHTLWYHNKYQHQWKESTSSNIIKSVIFGLISVYSLIIIVYSIIVFVTDIIHIKNGTLHKKSKLYQHQLLQQVQQQQNQSTKTNPQKQIRESYVLLMFQRITKMFAIDSTNWILLMFIGEIFEIILQSQALLLYNGYNVFDPDQLNYMYLANKPMFIRIFTVILSLNCFCCGVIWLSYSLIPKYCYGLTFKTAIFVVDQCSDLFYCIFPIIIVYYDDYNEKIGSIAILLGQLNVNSTLQLIATFMPLLFLLNKCLVIIINSQKSLRDEYYARWKFIVDLSRQQNDKSAVYQAKLQGFDISRRDLAANKKEIYDSSTGNLRLNYSSQRNITRNWVINRNNNSISPLKTIILIVISLIYITYGIILLVLITQFLNESDMRCNSVTESHYFYNNTLIYNATNNEQSILQQNPELFLYDKCLYKIYPFTNNNRYKCQCRILVIEDWNDLHSNIDDRNIYFNLTQKKILNGMLQNYYMLEKFHSNGVEDKSVKYELKLNDEINHHQWYMKAFELSTVQLLGIEEGIFSKWNKLEYLKIADVDGMKHLPNDIDKLKQIKYLSLKRSGLDEIHPFICNLITLEVLQIETETIESIPFCISKLQNLQKLIFEDNIALKNIPLSIFTLPQLIDLSVFTTSINYQSLLSYNLLNQSIDINDTNATNKWFNDNFKWNTNTTIFTNYWFGASPLCDENRALLPSKLKIFLKKTNYETNKKVCYDPAAGNKFGNAFCSPLLWGNGRCDFECQGIAYDGGDCIQLCFADPELQNFTNCTWQQYKNPRKCDLYPGCDNKYCVNWKYHSNFKDSPRGGSVCGNSSLESFNDFEKTPCWNSQSNYIQYPDVQYSKCGNKVSGGIQQWTSDGVCDDACYTEECLYDEEDCNKSCGEDDDPCSLLYSAWSFFFGTSVYKIDHDSVCKDIAPLIMSLLPQSVIDGALETLGCNGALEKFDWNHDGMLNFREFSVMGYATFHKKDFIEPEKASQINCSRCVGVKNYDA